MTTSEQLTGSKQYPQINLIAPLEALEVKLPLKSFEVLNEDGEVVDYQTKGTPITLAGGTHFVLPIETYDLYNNIKAVKEALESAGYVLGGEDFNNTDPKAFWLLEYGLLVEFLNTSILNVNYNENLDQNANYNEEVID
jgi:hypothetical protein